jgi:hypothetical protein
MSYETVLDLVLNAGRAPSGDLRDIVWISDAHVVGVARDHEGRIEVFLGGAELRPTSKLVEESIEFRTWHRSGKASLSANRLVLPALGHFDQVAAFICTELLRNGADVALSRAFAKTEPIIELAIKRLQMSNEVLLGLAGELLMLDALTRHAQDDRISRVIDGWDGWRRSSRDFVWGTTGVEVKTTTRPTSSHLVQGVHQLETRDPHEGGDPEDRLYLVSIGLQTADSGDNTFSIPLLVSRICERTIAAGSGSDVSKFLSRVSEYGAESGGGYDHQSMSEDPAYAVSFLTAFCRGYDMSDKFVEVLRRDDVAIRHHVDISSLRFRVDLPPVASVGNPIAGANQVAKVILDGAA